MKNHTKKWLIAAVSLLAIGAIMLAAAMTVCHWDFTKLETDRYETHTHKINEEFTDIKLNTETADIQFAISDDNICRVICYENTKAKHSVSVQDGTLRISAEDERKWYEHIGFNFQTSKVTVYLPKSEYRSLVIKESTGDIKIDAIETGMLDISVSTGEIKISDVICDGDINAIVSTGELKIINSSCKNLITTGSTGDITLKKLNVSEKISIQRSTGNVAFDCSDASEISVKTTTGDIFGSLLGEKIFIAESSTGSINIPKTNKGGKCELITSTGNINIKIC